MGGFMHIRGNVGAVVPEDDPPEISTVKVFNEVDFDGLGNMYWWNSTDFKLHKFTVDSFDPGDWSYTEVVDSTWPFNGSSLPGAWVGTNFSSGNGASDFWIDRSNNDIYIVHCGVAGYGAVIHNINPDGSDNGSWGVTNGTAAGELTGAGMGLDGRGTTLCVSSGKNNGFNTDGVLSRFSLTGTYIDRYVKVGSGYNATFQYPAMDSTEDVFAYGNTGSSAAAVTRVDVDTGTEEDSVTAITTYPSGVGYVSDIEVDEDDKVWISEESSSATKQIYKFDIDLTLPAELLWEYPVGAANGDRWTPYALTSRDGMIYALVRNTTNTGYKVVRRDLA